MASCGETEIAESFLTLWLVPMSNSASLRLLTIANEFADCLGLDGEWITARLRANDL
jgi:hypothetical protein